MAALRFITTVLIAFPLIKSNVLYSEEELKLIEALGASLNTKSYAFVQNEISWSLIKELKVLSEMDFYSVVLSTQQLNEILDNSGEAQTYFERKTLIVTKYNLNFTDLLPKISGPVLLYWVVFVESLDWIQTSYIPANADLFVVQCSSNSMVINKVYHLKPERNLSVNQISVWEIGRNVLEFADPVPKIQKIDFENVTLNTLVFLDKEQCIGNTPLLALDRMECFQQELIEIVAEKLNFTTNIVQCHERVYPYNYPNGTLSELFLMLKRNEVDLSSASYIINNPRLEDYDFVWPTFTTRSMLYIKLRTRQTHWRAYLRPLNRQLWLAIVGWIITAGLTIYIFEEFRTENLKFHWYSLPNAIVSIYVPLQVFCNQGLYNISNWSSNRMVYLLSFLLVLVVYQAYSGGLISSLTVAIPHIPFKTLEGLFRDGTYKIMTLKSGFHNYYFTTRVNKSGHIDFMLQSEQLPHTITSGISKLCHIKKIAFIELRENIVQHHLFCKITEIPRPLMYQSIGIGFPKNSPFQKFINSELTILHSTGILQRMRTHLFSYVKLIQKDISDDDYEPVTTRQVVSLFTLLLGGVIISFGIFFFEIFWYYTGRLISKFCYKEPCKTIKNRTKLRLVPRKRNLACDLKWDKSALNEIRSLDSQTLNYFNTLVTYKH